MIELTCTYGPCLVNPDAIDLMYEPALEDVPDVVRFGDVTQYTAIQLNSGPVIHVSERMADIRKMSRAL